MYHRTWQAGLTLLEILVGIVLASFVVLVVGSGFVFVTREWYGQQARLEAQQNLRSAVERVVRELRLAGVCLPQAGEVPDLIPIQGTDEGVQDQLTFRANRTCAKSTLRATYSGGGAIHLNTVEGFTAGMQAYIWNPNTRTGEFFRIARVDPASRSIEPASDTPIAGRYPGAEPPSLDASVIGVEEQRYRVGQDSSGVPELRVSVNPLTWGGGEELLARGIEHFNLRYVLQRSYRPEDCVGSYSYQRGDTTVQLCVKEQPVDAAEWSLVRAVFLEVGARSTRPVAGLGGDGFYRIRQGDFATAPIVVRPRNLLHHGD